MQSNSPQNYNLMLHIKYCVSCLQAAQNTVEFNEKPSREFWDTICTSVCSASFANLKCNFAKSPFLSGQPVTVPAATVAGKGTRGLTNPAGIAADSKPSAPSHSPLARKPAFLPHFTAYFQNSSTVLHAVLYFLILKP